MASRRAAPCTSGSPPTPKTGKSCGRVDFVGAGVGVFGCVGVTSRTTVSLGADATVTTSSYRAAVMIASWTDSQRALTWTDLSRPVLVPIRKCLALKPIDVQQKHSED